MNLQLANVISDISGATGLAILRAIVAGERDPNKLSTLKNNNIRASREEIAQSLEGDWRSELLFVLEQSLQLYDTFLAKIAACDQRVQAHLKTMESKVEDAPQPSPETRPSRKDGPRFDLRSHLHRIAGVDLTRVDGLNIQTVQPLFPKWGWT